MNTTTERWKQLAVTGELDQDILRLSTSFEVWMPLFLRPLLFVTQHGPPRSRCVDGATGASQVGGTVKIVVE